MVNNNKEGRKFTIWIISFLIVVFLSVSLVGCGKIETRTFKELIQSKAYWADPFSSSAYYRVGYYTGGLVIYQTYHREMRFLIVTYPGVSKEVMEKESIVVIDKRGNSAYQKDREDKTKIAVGDIISVRGEAGIAVGTVKNGDKITVYYFVGSSINKTSTVDIEDADFNEPIKVVSEQIQRNIDVAFQTWIAIIGSIPALMSSY